MYGLMGWGGVKVTETESCIQHGVTHFTLFEIFDTIFDGGIIFPIDAGALTS